MLAGGTLLVLCGTALGAEKPSSPQLTELFLPPVFSDLKISPTGEYIGFVARQEDEFAIGVYTVATGKIELGKHSGVRPIDFWWKGARRLLVLSTSRERDAIGYMAVDVDGKNREDVWRIVDARGVVIDALPDDPRHVLLARHSEIVRLDIETGASERTALADGGVGQWILDEQARARGSVTPMGHGEIILEWNTTPGGKWQRRTLAAEEKRFQPFAVAENPRFLLGWDFAQEGEVTLSRFDTVTGERAPVVRKPGLDPTHALLLGKTRRALTVNYAQGAETLTEPVDDAQRAAVQLLRERFTGFFPLVIDAMPDGVTWLVLVQSSRLPGTYVLFNTRTGEVASVAQSHEAALREERFAPAEFFSFAGRSGGQLTGRIWRPAGDERPPLVVVCPRTLPGRPVLDVYNADVQALVACGFAVARVNVRGTLGFGHAFRASADGDVAQRLTEDLEDVVHALATENVVDGSRVSLAGWRMGGALAIQVAARSGVFQSVAAIDAPAVVSRRDLAKLSEEREIGLLTDRLGGWWESGKIADDLSPVSAVEKLKVPLLLVCKKDSLGGLAEDTSRIARAAKAKKVSTKTESIYSWSKYPKVPTQLAREDAAAMRELVDFFEQAASKSPGKL